MLTSQLCTYRSLTSPELEVWARRLRPIWDPDGDDPKARLVHRKMWEWLFIAQALSERKMLAPGRRGLGFGVGREPLVALFAAHGCELLATDLHPDQARAAGWTATGGEYSGELGGLNEHGLCPTEEFRCRVAYRHVDMNHLPEDLGQFDFTWSSCALEHLGSLQAGMDFLLGQLRFVRPGGVAVHTTEFNVSSNDRTVDDGATVLYRRRDIEKLARRLRRRGFWITCDLRLGESPEDCHVDVPPFSDTHLRTTLGEFVTTSLGLIVERPLGDRTGGARRWMPPMGGR